MRRPRQGAEDGSAKPQQSDGQTWTRPSGATSGSAQTTAPTSGSAAAVVGPNAGAVPVAPPPVGAGADASLDDDAAPATRVIPAPHLRALPQPVQLPTGRLTYPAGAHGGRAAEQDRLTRAYGVRVRGTSSHESEHTIGQAVLTLGAGLPPRGTPGDVSTLENLAPAYQEQHAFHRAHIGTGNHARTVNPDGTENRDSSDDYRNDQRAALEEGSAGNAVQLNQLHYRAVPGFPAERSVAQRQADDSFRAMLAGTSAVRYAAASPAGPTFRQVLLTPQDRAEADLSRQVVRGEFPVPTAGMDDAARRAVRGGFPTDAAEDEARKRYGVPDKSAAPVPKPWPKPPPKPPPPPPGVLS